MISFHKVPGFLTSFLENFYFSGIKFYFMIFKHLTVKKKNKQKNKSVGGKHLQETTVCTQMEIFSYARITVPLDL